MASAVRSVIEASSSLSARLPGTARSCEQQSGPADAAPSLVAGATVLPQIRGHVCEFNESGLR
jgi:hypothetical protein